MRVFSILSLVLLTQYAITTAVTCVTAHVNAQQEWVTNMTQPAPGNWTMHSEVQCLNSNCRAELIDLGATFQGTTVWAATDSGNYSQILMVDNNLLLSRNRDSIVSFSFIKIEPIVVVAAIVKHSKIDIEAKVCILLSLALLFIAIVSPS